MFASVRVGQRIERATCEHLRAAAAACDGLLIELAGGVAVHAGAESPVTKVAGLGFAGAVDLDQLGEVERAFADRGGAVAVELSTLAETGIAEQLTRRGYVLTGFEDVLGRSLGAQEAIPSGAEDISVAPSDAPELEVWTDVLVEGFAHPDSEGVSSHESFPRDVLRRALESLAPTYERFLGRRNGEPAAAASMSVIDGIAMLSGSATLPQHRRRGLQTALLHARLAEARSRGAELATVTTSPGSKSKANAQRQGFVPLFTRAVLVRQP